MHKLESKPNSNFQPFISQTNTLLTEKNNENIYKFDVGLDEKRRRIENQYKKTEDLKSGIALSEEK